MSGVAALGVTDLAHAVRSRQANAVDIVRDHLDAAAHSQPVLNAFTHLEADAAMHRAAAIDAAAARGNDPGPLCGVPIALKDLIDHAGRPTTNGGSFPPDVPSSSAPVVERLEAAGAVIIGRTGLHEFAFGFSSENHWFGPVRNPWDTSLSPGGSSGGSGAAVAAGLAPAALGTDTGGSIRVPAALCGIVGLKVTHGRVPLRGVTPLAASLDTVGPMARSVADAAAVYAVIAGDDPHDPWSRPAPVDPFDRPADLAATRFVVPHPWVDATVADEVAAGFTSALERLAAAGATVHHADIPDLQPPGMIEAAMYPEVAAAHRDRWRAGPERYGPGVRRRLQRAFGYGVDDLVAGLAWRRSIQSATQRLLEPGDVLITPTVGALRKEIGVEDLTIAGETLHYRAHLARFSALVNHLGFPALALPLDAPGAPPPSLQLIGLPWSEASLLAIGLALEDAGVSVVTQPPHWRP